MSLDTQARAFALSRRVAHLGTADAATGQPHVVPICFALINDVVYFVIDQKPKRETFGLRRLRNIRSNPRVAVLWDQYEECWQRLAYLLAFGQARIVVRLEEWEQAVEALRARYRPYTKMDLLPETNPAVAIELERYHFWRATAPGDAS